MAARKAKGRTRAKRTVKQTIRRPAGPDSAVFPDVPVVAIGASAGGLEPIGRLLAAMPADSGLSFVVIQHLDPVSKSLLPELLARKTTLRVQPASNDVRLVANQVYVIPPGVYLSILSGTLQFSPLQAGKSARMPIDLFLHSLAAEYGNRGIGIIMSGTGTDGTEGLKALKEAGGLALVQDPSEAQHSGMPRNAVILARPDYVLPVAEMPGVLLRYVAHNYAKTRRLTRGTEEVGAAEQGRLASLVEQIKTSTGKDFGLYKPGTLQRRVERRMALNGIPGWPEYLALLHRSPSETDALVKDLLINVTGFFRDPEAFAALAAEMPGILAAHSNDQPVRAWVAGCSTGEEAYSLAVLFLEQIAAAKRRVGLQIFATDIDDEALEIARAGLYSESIQADVSPERLHQFFIAEDGRFRIVKELREAVIFSRHDILHDPPFSRLDVLSCRNLLIYLVPAAQRHVLGMLHFALLERGLMLLGAAESVNSGPSLFEAVDENHRIYRRRDHDRAAHGRLAVMGRMRGAPRTGQLARPVIAKPLSLPEVVQRMMLQTYAPAAVAVNRQLAPLYFFGAADRYLQIPSGEPNQNLLSIAREGLRAKLRETIARAFRTKRRVVARGAWLARDGKSAPITIEAQPLADDRSDLALVSFIEESPNLRPSGARRGAEKSSDRSEVALLRQQLAEARRELNRTIRELHEANEDLRVNNEEAMSLNEEFLSTNEELESSKEELQSLNEELTTLNIQLRQTLEQQEQTAADLSNLLNSSSTATILLDSQLRIKIFNPRMRELFALIDTDVGRPLVDLVPKFADPELLADAISARSAGTSSNREIRADSGLWYLRSAAPYRTESGELEGVVVTFADVSALKEAELAELAARQFAETVIDAVREPLAVVDQEVRLVSANAAFGAVFNLPTDGIAGRALTGLGHPALSQPGLQELVASVLARQEGSGQAELVVEQAGGSHRVFRAKAQCFQVAPSDRPMALLVLNDVTEERQVAQRQLQLVVDAMPEAVVVIDRNRRIRFVSRQMEPLFGYPAAELIGQEIDVLIPPEVKESHAELHARFFLDPALRRMAPDIDVVGIAKDGRKIPLEVGLSPVATVAGMMVIADIHDLRSLKAGERELREAKVAADRANRAKSRFLAAASHDLRQPLQAISLLHGVLGKRLTSPEMRAIFGKLDNTTAYMAQLLDTLLDINQIDRGAVQPEFSEFPLAPLFHRAGEDFLPLAAEKHLQLRIVPCSVVVRSDAKLLTRMVGNLLANAIKYTDRGKVLLGARRRGHTIRIEVHDTGIGIASEHMEDIFEEFHRIHGEESGRRGLGLGLYFVRRFALLLGHTVEVLSRPGKGTIFAIVVSATGFAGLGSAADAAGSAASSPTALLVEDDPEQLAAMRQLLALDGYRVVAAETGAEALSHLNGPSPVRPHIIIADYHLAGGMNGIEVIRRVRDELRSEIPALVVSGEEPSGDFATIGGDQPTFIAKPVQAEELLATAAAKVSAIVPSWRRHTPRMPASAAAGVPSDAADVAIVDDDPGVRDALAEMLEAEGYKTSSFASAEAFLADPHGNGFRCLIADLRLPGMDGLALQKHLATAGRNLPIVFLTGASELPIAVTAMREGAADFLQKPVGSTELRESIARALEQRDRSNGDEGERDAIAARLATLTERERQVMERMVAGELTKNIAAALGISQRTAEHHRQNVLRKMATKSLAQLVRMVGMRSTRAPGVRATRGGTDNDPPG